MSDIFISYAREDRARAKVLSSALERQGWAVWWDREILPGERFQQIIKEALDEARCVIVLWSKWSVDSDWVLDEAAEGKRRRILVPALIDDVVIPLGFRGFQTAHLVDWDGKAPHSEFDTLLKALCVVLDKPSLPKILEPTQDELEHPKPTGRETYKAWSKSQKAKVLAAICIVTLIIIVLIGTFIKYSQPKTYSLTANFAHNVVTNSIGMKLVYIPAGSFMMGSSDSAAQLAKEYDAKAEDFEDEFPQHQVRISKGFWMSQTEITQGQYESVMNAKPWSGEDDVQVDANNPAVCMTWDDAVEFCMKLSEKEGTIYRLPTEAEWEYACRALTTTRFNFGNSDSSLDAHAWFKGNAYDVGQKYAHRVGQKKPNPWGLYDIHGNVWEWCEDWYAHDYYEVSPTNDPIGPDTGSGRVIRGGAWHLPPQVCRSAFRNSAAPSHQLNGLGFRVARSFAGK